MANENLQQQFDLDKIQEVADKFQAIEGLKNTAIDISIKGDGIIVLSGTIKSEEHYALAAKVAEEIPGIFHVENNLTVAPI